MQQMASLFQSVVKNSKPRNRARSRHLHLPAPVAVCVVAAASAVAVCLAAEAWRSGRAQRFLRFVWDGDVEGQRRRRHLKNITRVREVADEFEVAIAEVKAEMKDVMKARDRRVRNEVAGARFSDVASPTRENRLRKTLTALNCEIDGAFKYIDQIQGDEVVRAARKAQASRLEALGVLVDLSIKLLSE